MGELVDLDEYRAKKQAEEAEAEAEAEVEDVNYMRAILDQLMASLGQYRSGSTSIVVVPISSSDYSYSQHYPTESGYYLDGYQDEPWYVDLWTDDGWAPDDDENI